MKDYGRRPFWFRNTVGRFVISREVTIYGALDGLSGIPRFFGRVGGLAFVVERIEGLPISGFRKRGLPDGFLERLRDLIAAMHGRGVVHWDLRQRRNILVGADGDPYVIDFASGVRFPPGSFIHRLASLPDISALAKLKEKHAPHAITSEDRRLIRIELLRPFRRRRKRRRREKLDRMMAEKKARKKAATGP